MKSIFDSLDNENVEDVYVTFRGNTYSPSFNYEPFRFKQQMIEYLSKEYILIKRSDLEALKLLSNLK